MTTPHGGEIVAAMRNKVKAPSQILKKWAPPKTPRKFGSNLVFGPGIGFTVAFEEAAVIRGLMSDEEWACP